MKIRFIGTGSGKTSPVKFHSSILVSVSGYNLLVDTGDSISRALISQNISYDSINGILISHMHPDHFSGFSALIVQMQMTERKESLDIFVHHTLIKKLKETLRFSYIFPDRMKFHMNYRGFEFDKKIMISPELTFSGRKNTHLSEYEKYNSSLSYACGSFLFTSGDKNVFYSGDVGSDEDLLLFKDKRIDIFITEASHVSMDSILSISDKLKPGRIFITHINDEDTVKIQNNLKIKESDLITIAQEGLILSV